MNFESALRYDIKDYKDLYTYIKKQIKNNNKNIYIIRWSTKHQRMGKSSQFNISWYKFIYITGSNAYLLSSESTTLLAGQILTIKIFPFSFKKFAKEYPFQKNEDKYKKFDKYLKYGGMQMLVNMNDNEELIKLSKWFKRSCIKKRCN